MTIYLDYIRFPHYLSEVSWSVGVEEGSEAREAHMFESAVACRDIKSNVSCFTVGDRTASARGWLIETHNSFIVINSLKDMIRSEFVFI